MSEYMIGKEIVNLINVLEQKGMSAEEIIEIIKIAETTVPPACPKTLLLGINLAPFLSMCH